MERWFIEDRAVEDAGGDAFNAEHLADQLEHAIQGLTPPATIGLIGGFGTGKTTVANLLARRVANHGDLALLIVSVEKHSGVPRQRALVYAIAEALETNNFASRKKITDQLARLEQTNSFTATTARTEFLREVTGRRFWTWLGVLGAVTALAVAVDYLFAHLLGDRAPRFWVSQVLAALTPMSFWALLGREVLRDWLKPGNLSKTQARAEAADEIERVFQDLVMLCERRLVIVVENLDRLDEKDVLDAIGAIRSLRDVPRVRPPVFIVPCDEGIVRRALATAHASVSPHDPQVAEERATAFLDKWFSIRLHMPPSIQSDVRDWADKLVETNHTGAERLRTSNHIDQVLDVLLHDAIGNKRHLIKRLNGFFAEYRLAALREAGGVMTKGSVTGNPVVLARLVVLRDFYPATSKVIEREHALLWALDGIHTGGSADAETEDLLPLVSGDEHIGALRYLRGTAAFARAPRNLQAFLAFTQPGHSRFVGSDAADEIRRALEDGSVDEVQERVATAGDDHERLENIVDIAIDAVREARKGLRLTNAVRTAARLLEAIPARLGTRLANVIALRLAEDSTATPEPTLLASVILRTEFAHRHGLIGALLTPASNEDADRLLARGIAMVRVAGESPTTDPRIVIALDQVWATQAETPTIETAMGWLSESKRLTAFLGRLTDGLPSQFFVAMFRSLSQGDEVTETPDELVSLLHSSSSARKDSLVLHALVELATSSSNLRGLALRLLGDLERISQMPFCKTA